ncbi:MAG: septal ring lytic transglycosylase RlpA family protein [Microgenomates group bacterium]|jgi:rare lipoprotein A (peptidoglycan hydrolase)
MGKEKDLKYTISSWATAAVIAGISYLPFAKNAEALPFIEMAVQPQKQLIPPGYHPTQYTWTGDTSYYTEDGCYGCRADRLMANGKRFDENAYTIAFMRAPLGSKVLITNVATGESCVAEVTDHGNFEENNLIADLSKAVKETLGGSKLRIAKITLLEPNPQNRYRLLWAD